MEDTETKNPGIEPDDATDTPDRSPSVSARAAPDVSTTVVDPGRVIGSLDPIVVTNPNFPSSLGDDVELFQGTDGHAYLRRIHKPWLPVLRVGTKAADSFLRRLAHARDRYPKTADIRDVSEHLIARAEVSGTSRAVWYRVAPERDGSTIDLGDVDGVRVYVGPGRVEILTGGSEVNFYRPATMLPLVLPAAVGDLPRLYRYINLPDGERILFVGWITYTLAHAKTRTTSFPILVLLGDQGSGKSVMCRIIQSLIDPSVVGLQTLPRDVRDLAIASQGAHVLLYDNIRAISPDMSDKLCVAATGGTFATRRLFSDSEQVLLPLHVALVVNGLTSFITEPDLAQRCLPLTLRSLDENARRDEATLERDFQVDQPHILRGLLDLTAGILAQLPTTKASSPERMIDFSRWLAAMERVDQMSEGNYQKLYSATLNDGMLDSLLENPLAAAILSLIDAEPSGRWSDTPAELYQTLCRRESRRTLHAREWPANPIALGRRLDALHVAFRRQGVEVRRSRSTTRLITITRVKEVSRD